MLFTKKLKISFIVILFSIAGCSHVGKSQISGRKFPLKIGMVADSQITTKKGVFDYGMRKKAADKFVNVAVRPAAVEYLAPKMLEYFLSELKNNEVDLILYLGDGANSGCKDELNKVFGILSKFRENSKIPIYYTIGNHDYLGAGNQAIMAVRENLCDSGFQNNPPETKHEVLGRIRKFNLANKGVGQNFSFQELYSMPKGVLIGQEIDKSHFYSYYGGILKYDNKKDDNVEILLADTSDYANVVLKPHELWGIKAGLSYQENKYKIVPQINNFLQHNGEKPDYRLIASHYQPTNSMTPSLATDDIMKLMHGKRNYWLSGHTHSERAKVYKRKVGKLFRSKYSFLEFNVGSTTDYYPHVAILESNSGFNNKIDGNLGYRIIKHQDNKPLCSTILGYVQSNKNSFQRVSSKNHAKRIMGIDKSYRDKNWSSMDIKRVRENIDQLIKVRKSINDKITKKDVISCLTIRAVENERSFWDKFKSRFNFREM